MIRRPPRSTLSSSSAASDVYKRQLKVVVTTLLDSYLSTLNLQSVLVSIVHDILSHITIHLYSLIFFFFFFFFFFKQKTAYEMLRSLVGSEMCIRDRLYTLRGVQKIRINAEIKLDLHHQ
eukprot:TRINITY_DN85_c0_g1_i9.p1 TRINITY_DN85_c0_g1~~TRINITY_DN85_c0_g1_i9.p1  ORF type:complete len:120 (+),score=40.06 TRINITY_DN85_c0_g1_i9:176-535(+)